TQSDYSNTGSWIAELEPLEAELNVERQFGVSQTSNYMKKQHGLRTKNRLVL
ncbi:MAG: hypothetical protein ACJAZ2_002416, partial [Glaciecola sp.]